MHSWSLPVLLVLAPALLPYARGWGRLSVALPGVLRPWRPAAFAAGMLVLFAASRSPLAMLDYRYLTAHMAQHLLLMTLAAPLILLGDPVITLLYGLPPPMSGLLRRRCVPQRFSALLTHPVFCWLACTAVVIGWHIPALFQLGMRSRLGHAFEQVTFLSSGLLFWWPVIQPWPAAARWPSWSIPVYLFAATLPCDALAAFLCFCNRVVYAHYLNALHASQIAVLKDQACAGALMWVWVTFDYLFPAAGLTFRLLSPERRFKERQVV